MSEIQRFQSSDFVCRERVSWMINPRTYVHFKIEDGLCEDFILNVWFEIIILLHSQ